MIGGFLWFSAVPTVRGEEELAFLSSSTDLVTACWKTLGDSRTEDTEVVVAVARGGPAICGGEGEDNGHSQQRTEVCRMVKETWVADVSTAQRSAESSPESWGLGVQGEHFASSY